MFGKKQPGTPSSLPPQGGAGLPVKATDSEEQLPVIIPENKGDRDLADQQGAAREPLAGMAAKAASQAKKEEVLAYMDHKLETPDYRQAKATLVNELINSLDFDALQRQSEDSRRKKVSELIDSHLAELTAPLTAAQIELIREQVIDEVLGLGPLEPLLADAEISDIMINSYKQVYVEKSGKIYLSDITFLSESHLLGIIQRIVSRVGRRVDEASPMVDARLEDGSRFNAIIPPLALDGSLVSIRKFKKTKMSLREYVDYNSMTPEMARLLEILASIRMNVIISGGTGSGKTTLLNALSEHIDMGERVITIEDAAELQLNQPHVLRLETRPASTEGSGEITQRQLVKNALRMRPDRIILGEIRGDEVIDVLSAMNTGHDGSMVTIHSNSPRDCLARIENLVGMSGVEISPASLRYQIASAVQIIVQLSRMRDGRRRITQIEEIVGIEGTVISTQTLYLYKPSGMSAEGILEGNFECSGIRPRCMAQAEYYGCDKEMAECMGIMAR